MKRLIHRTSMGALALVSFGSFACEDSDGTALFPDDIVLTGNGGSAGAGGSGDTPAQGGSAGSETSNGGSSGASNGGSSGSGNGGSSGAGNGGSSGAGNGGSSGSGNGGSSGSGNGGSSGSGNGGSSGSGNGGSSGSGNGGSSGSGNGGSSGSSGNPVIDDPLNLLDNPHFEEGVNGWSAAFGGQLTASTAQAHTGTQSALVSSRTQTYQGAHVNVTSIVEAGATYSVGAFARVSAASDNVKLTARIQCVGQADQYKPLKGATAASNTAWTELSGELVIPSELDCALTSVLVYVEGPGSGVDLYVDDASLVLTSEPEDPEDPEDPDNLITNSTFEAGIEDWSAAFGGTLAVATDQAHGGSQSAIVTGRTGTYQGAHYDLTGVVDMGATYSFQAFARLGGAASDTVNLTARLSCDGQADQYIPIDSLTASNTEWSELSGELVLPTEFECFPTQLLVYVEGPAAGVDLYVDDVVGLETAPAEELGNLITNPNFESGLSDWSAAFGGTLALSTDPVHGGAQSAVVTGRTGTYQGVHYDMTNLVAMGATYSFSAFTRIAGAASDTVNLTARLKCDGRADQYLPIDSLTATNSGWSHLSGDLTLPAEFECFKTQLLVYAEGPAAGVDLYLDDVIALETEAAPVVENLFTNRDFEAGVAGWTAAFGGTLAASTAQAHSGAQSAAVTSRTGTYQGAFVNMTSLVDPGATYSFSVFARLGGAATGPLRLTARVKCDGQADQYKTIASVAEATDTAWSLLNGNLIVPADYQCDLNELLVYVENAPVGVDIYVDDAWAVQTAAAPEVVNVISNSDFESGITGWTAAFGGNIAVSTDQAHSGAQSAVVTNRTGTYQGAFVDMTSLVEQGRSYAFSAFTRVGGSDSNVNLTARIQCASLADQYVTIDNVAATTTGWGLLSGNLAVPSEAACTLNSLLVYVEGAPIGVDIYVDDVWSVLLAP